MSKREPKVILSYNIFKLIIEGRVRIARDKKLKYGRYRIIKRYVPKV